jgi:hypothetical protein
MAEPAPGLAQGGGAHYLGVMPLPRPTSPRVLWADLRAFAAQRSRYQWVSFGAALAMPAALIWLFVLDSDQLKPRPRVTFVESWSAARTDDEIKVDQTERERLRQARQEEIRQQWKRLGDRTGINP